MKLILLLITLPLFAHSQRVNIEAAYMQHRHKSANITVNFANTETTSIGIGSTLVIPPKGDPQAAFSLRGIMYPWHLVINIQPGYIVGKVHGMYTRAGIGVRFGKVYVLANAVAYFNSVSWDAGVGVRF